MAIYTARSLDSTIFEALKEPKLLYSMLKKIAFVTCSTKPDFAVDDMPAVDLLKSKGIEVQPLPWDVDSDQWNLFDSVVIRSCWNYHLLPEKFMQWLDRMESQKVKLFNSAKTVRWNLHKGYLQELEGKGVPLPETIWLKKGASANLSQLITEKNWEKAVVKPAISAAAFNTFLVSKEEAHLQQLKFIEQLQDADLLVQKFMPQVQQKGEWSLIFFDKKFSHAVIKRPAAKDFRVQDEFGGSAELASPPSFALEQAQKILSLIDESLLYTRVDGVISNNQFLLMELELIEPMLFLADGKDAAERFAEVIIHGFL
jgi:glutathione synthase/RimK-type ligase-like ATP-grasp enzyme